MSDEIVPAEPARPLKPQVKYSETADTLILHRRNRGGCVAIFLAVWLTGWTLGCIAMAVAIIAKPSLGMVAFGIPFWVAWLFVAGMWTWMTFGTETLVLGPATATCLRTAIIKLSSRSIPRSECVRFQRCEGIQNDNGRGAPGIELQTLGQPLRIMYGVAEDELAWLLFQLNNFIGYVPPVEDRRQAAELIGSAVAAPEPEVDIELTDDQTLPTPPSDSAWRLDDDGWTFTLSRRGRLNMALTGGLLFATLFWNGIVSVFVLLLLGVMPTDKPPQGKEWWGLFFFLIPFELIGLVLLLAFLSVVLAPWRKTRWRFDRDQLVRLSSLLAFQRTKTWPLTSPVRLELRSGPDVSLRRSQPTLGSHADSSWSVVLVAEDGTDVCAIEELTEGEGRWIGHLIRDRRPDWVRDHS
ncbi:MAG: hypothetical protein U0795_11705 [Pirellulales bacterium]